MINDFTKVVAILFLMWIMPHCANKTTPAKTVQADVALSVQEDCLIIAIERRLNRLEAQTMQPVKETTTRGKIVPISASEAVRQ